MARHSYKVTAQIGDIELNLVVEDENGTQSIAGILDDQDWINFAQYLEGLVETTVKKSLDTYSVEIQKWEEVDG
jgi:hypothetical protein